MLLERKLFTVPARLWMNWQLWGGLLATLLLAQHAWVLFAPAERVLPGNTSIPLSNRTGQLFGTVTANTSSAVTSSLDGIRPIGIFAHSTRGFAVMQTTTGQRGVGLGSDVAPGIRLVETHADYVVLERSGTKQRVDLSAASATKGIASASPAAIQQAANPRLSANQPLLDRLAPEQQIMMKQMLQNNHRGLP
jgi:hypothetical protein